MNIFTPFRFFTEIATSSNLVDILVTKLFVENFDVCSRLEGLPRQRVCRQVLDTAKELHRIKNTYYALDSVLMDLPKYVENFGIEQNAGEQEQQNAGEQEQQNAGEQEQQDAGEPKNYENFQTNLESRFYP